MRLVCGLWLCAVSLACGDGAAPATTPADRATPAAPVAVAPRVDQSPRPCAPGSATTRLNPPLQELVARDPQLHLLTYEDLDASRQKVITRDEFAATDRGDTNEDGYEDLVAILVRCRDNTRTFAVAVFHGRTGDAVAETLWLPVGDFHILRVEALKGGVVVGNCYSCDVAVTFYWSGEAYEAGIRRPHDQTCTTAGATIHVAPDAGTRVLFTQRARPSGFGGYVEVLEIGSKTAQGSRWHKVRLLEWANGDRGGASKPIVPEVVGFMDSRDFDDEMGC